MKTIQAIVKLAAEAHPGDRLALATVVNVRGSSYRRPGARMLMLADGRSVGMISGGCLESDARDRARRVMATGNPELVTYDSTSPDDIVFGLGLGCNGVVQVLIESVVAGAAAGLPAFLDACASRRQPGRLATIFEADSVSLGARVLRWPGGNVTTNCRDPSLADALKLALQNYSKSANEVGDLTLPDGSIVRVLFETVTPPVPLTIFGAGDDAIPLAEAAKSLGWHVTVIDARPAIATSERFPGADVVRCLRPEALAADRSVIFPPESMVMVMTHNFRQDKALLREMMPRELYYLGVLGPKSRTCRLLDELAEEGVRFSDECEGRLHGPAGLDIGAETPEEIAVSILGEMQAVRARRPGGALRDRRAPIHEPFHPQEITP